LGIRSIGQIACIIIVFGALQFFILTFAAAFVYPGGFDYFGFFLAIWGLY